MYLLRVTPVPLCTSHPATQLFANFSAWFEFLKGKKLRTYFNDHPYPVAGRGEGGLQTSKEEVSFRWNGLSEWMARCVLARLRAAPFARILPRCDRVSLLADCAFLKWSDLLVV